MKIDDIQLFNKTFNEKKDIHDMFSNSFFSGFTLKDFIFGDSVYINNSTIDSMVFICCNLAGVHFLNAKFINSIFINCNFVKSDFFETQFENCIFENCNLLRVFFNRSLLKNCIFNINNDRRLSFSECRIEKVIYTCFMFNEFSVKFDDNEVVDLIYNPASDPTPLLTRDS